MNWQAIGAIAGILAVVIPALGSIIALAYTAGQHAQKLNSHQTAIEKLTTTQDEHTRAIGAWDQAMELLREVRSDVKGLLTGNVRPPRRRSGED